MISGGTSILIHHDRFDKFVEQWLAGYRAAGKRIYCQAGCDSCCHLAVHAAFPESIVVAAQLSAQRSLYLADYVQRLKNVMPELSSMKDYLKLHRRSLGPCPFLDEQGACAIYSIRPLSCRALLSTRSAEWCKVDFSELDEWDKQAYQNGLDHQAVAWPTHYVAASQDFAQSLEEDLIDKMQAEHGWSLSGNFAVMVWLELNFQLSKPGTTAREVLDLLASHNLDSSLILTITGN